MARDIIHEAVRAALENDNWIITNDPLKIDLEEEEKYFEIDLGAEKVIAAEKGNEKIAVEIKSFAAILAIRKSYDINVQGTIFVAKKLAYAYRPVNTRP